MKYQRIRNLREDKDFSQSYIGNAINVPQRTYSYYENGERTIPPQVLVALAIFHGTSIDYLLGLTDNPRPYERSRKTKSNA
ncbi:MAG: helix-turn-helix domain-containing protein [Oscillospiraceae bacterium]|nr:helix-turn-helix domain-containing protein [Oscillospiraceae bacterium]